MNLATDSKLRSRDLVRLRVAGYLLRGHVLSRATILQRKTRRHIRFELSAQPHEKQHTWISAKRLHAEDWPFPRRIDGRRRISTRPYARIVESWVSLIGLNPRDHGTHSLRRTEVTLTYRQTNNLRAVQLLLGHTKLENTTQHLAIEVDDALEIAERTDV